jgi:hypothetical protein
MPRPTRLTFDPTSVARNRRPSIHFTEGAGTIRTSRTSLSASLFRHPGERRGFREPLSLSGPLHLEKAYFQGLESPDQGEGAYRWANLSPSPVAAPGSQKATGRVPIRSLHLDPSSQFLLSSSMRSGSILECSTGRSRPGAFCLSASCCPIRLVPPFFLERQSRFKTRMILRAREALLSQRNAYHSPLIPGTRLDYEHQLYMYGRSLVMSNTSQLAGTRLEDSRSIQRQTG